MSSKYSQKKSQPPPRSSRKETRRSDWSQETYSAISVDDNDRKTSGRRKSNRGSRRLTILGAVAGGFLGHKIGDGKLGAITGAAIGAFGLRELGRRT